VWGCATVLPAELGLVVCKPVVGLEYARLLQQAHRRSALRATDGRGGNVGGSDGTQTPDGVPVSFQ
jgi:hypothetical protein